MGLNYKIVPSEVKVLDSVDCDRCNKHIESEHDAHWNEFGGPYSKFFAPMFKEEFFIIESTWGYFSKKDGEKHQGVLCEACYDEAFKDMKLNKEG